MPSELPHPVSWTLSHNSHLIVGTRAWELMRHFSWMKWVCVTICAASLRALLSGDEHLFSNSNFDSFHHPLLPEPLEKLSSIFF